MRARWTKSLGVASLVAGLLTGTAAMAAESGHAELPSVAWSFNSIFGTYDRDAQQRGFLVYKSVCASCHGLRLVAYRNLMEIGFTEDEVKAIAAEYSVVDGPDELGDMFERPATPADRFVLPFPNENAARASNGGALPPDLSLIVKARLGGADYIYGLLTGYHEPPAGVEVREGLHYNAYFPGQQIAMPPPLFDDAVEYHDGTPATVDQMAMDVTQFLAWTAEPNLEARHRMGVKVLLFLIVLTALAYAVKRKVWASVH
jgi:ubiquinol-cytochrome c reductase cytochrome c1 subunit